jgi:predicted transcriptional regulator
MDPTKDLSRRERQIMQIIFSRGSATAKQIVCEIPDPPSRTAIRTILTILVEKKLLKHKREGREFIYSPTGSKEKASRGALQNVLQTFFGGSIENLIASHFADPKTNNDPEALRRMEKLIKEARKKEDQA